MLNLPNILTLSRIFAVPLLAFFPVVAGMAAGLSDSGFGLYCVIRHQPDFFRRLPGARAGGRCRKMGIFSPIPIADKIMVAAVILVLTAQGYLPRAPMRAMSM